MRRSPFTALRANRARWTALATALAFVLSLVVTTGAAQAVVVSDAGNEAGVALVPGSSLPGSVSPVTASGPCIDPALTADLSFLNNSSPLCWHGGNVLHANETFALTWDPNRAYWSGTRGYIEQYLADVAHDSGTLNNPYALTTQYTDGSGRAAYASKYGGGCIDYGNPNNSSNTNTTCLFGSGVQSGPGNNYPANGCPVTGTSFDVTSHDTNVTCVTDGQIQQELGSVISQTNLLGHVQSGYAPLVVVLLPPQVESCLDTSGNLCSANSTASGQFCSYHSEMNVNGHEVSYVVQPWTVETNCDDLGVPAIPSEPPVDQLADDAGARLVSPISQAEMGAITDPGLDGWSALDGGEMNDNGCTSEPDQLDAVTINGDPYYLQREFNNAAALETDPNTYFGCAPNVILNPNFVVPSAIDQGDVVALDGSSTASTLIVPNAQYQWNFGDGTTAIGPSVVHTYNSSGTYNVTLNVTDRGGNQATETETITVLGSSGQAPGITPPPTTQAAVSAAAKKATPKLQVLIQLLPQSRKSVISQGIGLFVKSNAAANGIVTVSISRAEAKQAHIKMGRGATVVLARGTTSKVRNGTIYLYLKLPKTSTTKLSHLKRVTLTVNMALVGSGGTRETIVAAGRY